VIFNLIICYNTVPGCTKLATFSNLKPAAGKTKDPPTKIHTMAVPRAEHPGFLRRKTT